MPMSRSRTPLAARYRSGQVWSSGRETAFREVNLGPGEFDVIKLPPAESGGATKNPRAAGIVLQHDGDPGAVAAQGWLVDDDIGFSVPFGFRSGMTSMSSHDPTERILGTGVMIGKANPAMGFP